MPALPELRSGGTLEGKYERPLWTGIVKRPEKWQNPSMKTLVEIERAAEELPIAQRTELLLFLAESLRKEQAPLPEPRTFSEAQLKAWMDEDEEAMRRFKAGA